MNESKGDIAYVPKLHAGACTAQSGSLNKGREMNAGQRGVKKQRICMRKKRSKEGDMHATKEYWASHARGTNRSKGGDLHVKNRGQKGGDMHVKQRGAKGHTFETK
jgi:hypothetical protein